MIAEDILERGLRAAAAAVEVPPGGADAVRRSCSSLETHDRVGAARLRPHRPHTWRGWVAVAAAAATLLVGVPLAIGGSGSPRRSVTSSAGGAGGAASGFSDLSTAGGANPSSLRHQAQTAGGSSGGSVAEGSRRAASAVPPAVPTRTGPASAPSLVPGQPADRVVKTGNLALRVPKGQVATSLQRLGDLAGQEGGYVAISDQQIAGTDPSGQVTLRIPAARFTDTVDRASHLQGAHVLSLQTSGQDVTSQYVDLSARIGALQKVRASYLTLLGRASSIGQTLEVQDRIASVQSQIERLQGQRKLLSDQAAMSTLDVTVDQRPGRRPPVGHNRGNGFSHAVHISVGRFVRGVDAIVSVLGPLLLAMILVALAMLVGRFAVRRFRRHLV